MITVPGHAHAPRVDGLAAGRSGAGELEVGVAALGPRRLDAHRQLGVQLARLWEEALHVVLRRGVAVERALDGRRLSEAEQLLDELLAQRPGTPGGDVV